MLNDWWVSFKKPEKYNYITVLKRKGSKKLQGCRVPCVCVCVCERERERERERGGRERYCSKGKNGWRTDRQRWKTFRNCLPITQTAFLETHTTISTVSE